MKIMTYNVMEGGVKPDPSRLEKVLQVIDEQNADVFGLQETKIAKGIDNELLHALKQAGKYQHHEVFETSGEWTYKSGVSLSSKIQPSSSRIIGDGVRAVEMIFHSKIGDINISNVYLSHLSEAERVPQIKEMMQELRRNKGYNLIIGDFNALSPEDGIPQSAVDHFSPRMQEKYCKNGKLCYDTIETVLNEGYVDVGLQFFATEEITDKTNLAGGTGNHTRPIRMDFFFAKPELLLYVRDFVLVREGLALNASDHFPWYIKLALPK